MLSNLDAYFEPTVETSKAPIQSPIGLDAVYPQPEREDYLPDYTTSDNQLHMVNIYVQEKDARGNPRTGYTMGKFRVFYSPIFLQNNKDLISEASGKASAASDDFPPAKFHFWLKDDTGKILTEDEIDTRKLEEDPANSWGIFDFLRSKRFKYIMYK